MKGYFVACISIVPHNNMKLWCAKERKKERERDIERGIERGSDGESDREALREAYIYRERERVREK